MIDRRNVTKTSAPEKSGAAKPLEAFWTRQCAKTRGCDTVLSGSIIWDNALATGDGYELSAIFTASQFHLVKIGLSGVAQGIAGM